IWPPLVAPVLPRRLAPVLPTTYSPSYLHLVKAHIKYEHLESPYHTFVHCKDFATAASLRTRTSISVSFSRLGLSSPLLIIVFVSHYLTNKLISHRLILWHVSFERKHIAVEFSYSAFPSVSRVRSEEHTSEL